jgi:cell filamentation protein
MQRSIENLHHHLFQDVYRWAGHYRSVRIEKGQNVFCYPEHIPVRMDELFGTLDHGAALRIGFFSTFVEPAASFLGELNAIHPFREGNGRTQLSFLSLIAMHAGHPLRLDRVKQETLLPAMVASFAKDLAPLITELRKLRK